MKRLLEDPARHPGVRSDTLAESSTPGWLALSVPLLLCFLRSFAAILFLADVTGAG